ncbi:MAG: hypothetical protein FWG98_14350 [Candidatus Cloacimonetes bacterium]|nr:hypothetical protein [Candidatus Cloacimonadota bacterium]
MLIRLIFEVFMKQKLHSQVDYFMEDRRHLMLELKDVDKFFAGIKIQNGMNVHLLIGMET